MRYWLHRIVICFLTVALSRHGMAANSRAASTTSHGHQPPAAYSAEDAHSAQYGDSIISSTAPDAHQTSPWKKACSSADAVVRSPASSLLASRSNFALPLSGGDTFGR